MVVLRIFLRGWNRVKGAIGVSSLGSGRAKDSLQGIVYM